MLLAVDVGNTNGVMAVFDEDRILCCLRMDYLNADAAGVEKAFVSFAQKSNLDLNQLTDSVISSVVPSRTPAFIVACQNITHKQPLVMNHSMLTEGLLPVRLPKGSQRKIGMDLVCNAMALRTMFPQKSGIAVDFGTALTMTAVSKDGLILGSTICPGLKTAAAALGSNTSQVPDYDLEIPSSSLGQTTRECVQSGIVFGYRGLVQYLVSKIKDDMKIEYGILPEDIVVCATGGLHSLVEPYVDCFDVTDPDFTLKGLKACYDAI